MRSAQSLLCKRAFLEHAASLTGPRASASRQTLRRRSKTRVFSAGLGPWRALLVTFQWEHFHLDPAIALVVLRIAGISRSGQGIVPAIPNDLELVRIKFIF